MKQRRALGHCQPPGFLSIRTPPTHTHAQTLKMNRTTQPLPFQFHLKPISVRARDVEVPFLARQLTALQFSCEVDKLKTRAGAAIAWRAYHIWRVYVAISSGNPPETTTFDNDVVKQSCFLIAGKVEHFCWVDDNPLFWDQFLVGSSKVVEQEAVILEMLDYVLPVHTPHDNCTDDAVDAAIFSVVDLDVGLRHSTNDIFKAAKIASGFHGPSPANILSILSALPHVKQTHLPHTQIRKKQRTIAKTEHVGPIVPRPWHAISGATTNAGGAATTRQGSTTQ